MYFTVCAPFQTISLVAILLKYNTFKVKSCGLCCLLSFIWSTNSQCPQFLCYIVSVILCWFKSLILHGHNTLVADQQRALQSHERPWCDDISSSAISYIFSSHQLLMSTFIHVYLPDSSDLTTVMGAVVKLDQKDLEWSLILKEIKYSRKKKKAE